MGIFSDPCKNDDCSARVKKGANFCSVCGYAGANSLTACPECHKKVGRTSRFCWNCGADTAASKVPRIVGDRWVREEEEIAVRVNPDDLTGFLSRKVTVEPGTIGLIERGGRFAEEKEWGAHTLDGLFKLRGPSSILLLRAGDIVLRPTFRSLRDKDWAEVDVTVQAVLRIKDYDAFARQFFAGHKRRVTYTALENAISHELHDVLRGLVSEHGLDEMYGNLEWRDGFEAKVRDAMSVTLERYGLDLLQVNFVEFGGDAYEKLQQDHGEIYMGSHAADHLAEKEAIRRRVAELELQGKLGEFTSNKELADKTEELNSQYYVKSALRAGEREEVVAQARQEFELKKRLRAFELEDLEGERAKQKQDEQFAREQMLQKISVDQQNDVAISLLIARQKRDATQSDFEREQARLSDKAQRELEWQRSEQQRADQLANARQRHIIIMEEAEASLVAGKKTTELEIDKLRVREKDLDIQVKGEGERQRLKIELQKEQTALVLRMAQQDLEYLKTVEHFKIEKAHIDKEVELARIKGSVDIAGSNERLDAAVAREGKAQLEERLADQKASTKDWQAHVARQSDKDVRIAEITTRSNQAPPVIVVGGGGAQQVGGGMQGEAPCPHCNKPVPVQFPNCPYCKQSLMKT